MIFVEYIRPRPNTPGSIVRHHAPQDWTSDEDIKFANLGRTMKLGPEPVHMCWWQISGFDRVDAWERHLNTEVGRLYRAESPVAAALDFYRFGMFDLVFGGQPPAGHLHVAEFFDADAIAGDRLLAELETRQKRHTSITLAAVIVRIGKMGPSPGGIALWSAADYLAAEPLVRDQSGQTAMHVVEAGFYRDIGDEIS